MSGHPPRIQITLVHSEACHFCDDALDALTLMSKDHPISVQVVPLTSRLGLDLVARHRPAMNPLVLVDGRYFSSGRLPRKKLLKYLMAAAPAAMATDR